MMKDEEKYIPKDGFYEWFVPLMAIIGGCGVIGSFWLSIIH